MYTGKYDSKKFTQTVKYYSQFTSAKQGLQINLL